MRYAHYIDIYVTKVDGIIINCRYYRQKGEVTHAALLSGWTEYIPVRLCSVQIRYLYHPLLLRLHQVASLTDYQKMVNVTALLQLRQAHHGS